MAPRDEQSGRRAAVTGFANEHIAVGLLMKRYQNVSLVDLPLSTYDIVIARKQADGTEDIIRAQVKTANKDIGFTGGERGGSRQVLPLWGEKIPTKHTHSGCHHRCT